MYLKEMSLLSCRSWEVLFKIGNKAQKLFTDKLTSGNLKIVFIDLLNSKAFSPSTISFLRCYFRDLFTIIMMAAMIPIVVRPNVILKSESLNI